MNKHKLLQEDILPAMASNRKVQRLLNEFMDLLSEYGPPETITQLKHTTSSTLLLAKDTMDSDPPTDKTSSDPNGATKQSPIEQVDNTAQPTDQMESAMPNTAQTDCAPDKMILDNLTSEKPAPSANDKVS